MLETRLVEELVRIASAGGGFTTDASRRSTEELVRIAAAAKNGGHRPRIRFTGLDVRSTDELVRIAAAGGGCVEFA